MGIGESAALTAALLWAISSFLWGRIKLKAIELNTAKNLIGVVLLGLHILVLSFCFSGPDASEASEVATSAFQFRASAAAWWWLGLSGLVGIVIGDTFFFRSLQILGPRRALMMATFSPLFAVAISWVILGEALLVFQIMGVLTTAVGIVIVINEKQGKKETLDLFPGSQRAGVLLGIGAAICQATGAAISKFGMNIDDCTALEASLIRTIFSAGGTLLLLASRRQVLAFFRSVIQWSELRKILLASAIGTWLGIWLSQVAFKESPVGIAQTLLSTSPLFAIPLVRIIEGHKASGLAIAGTMVAIVGIAIAVWPPWQ